MGSLQPPSFALNVPQAPGFALQTQVGLREQESGAGVSLHQQVNVSLGLIEAGCCRFLQGIPDLLPDVLVDVDLGENTSEEDTCRFGNCMTAPPPPHC